MNNFVHVIFLWNRNAPYFQKFSFLSAWFEKKLMEDNIEGFSPVL